MYPGIPRWQHREIAQCIHYLRTRGTDHVGSRHSNKPARLIEVQVAPDKTVRDQVEQVLGSLPTEDNNNNYIAITNIEEVQNHPLRPHNSIKANNKAKENMLNNTNYSSRNNLPNFHISIKTYTIVSN